MAKKVALFCGHGKQTNGKWDAGCTYGKYTEAALMLKITKSAVKYLRKYGVKIVTDADSNNNINMVKQVAKANKEKCAIFVSVHCDYKKAPSGVMPLYVSAKGKKLATALNTAIKKGMPMKSRGVVRRTDLYELNKTSMPAVILETGSIKADLKTLKNNYDKYGKCIAKGICNYLGIKIPTAAAKKPAAKPAPAKKPAAKPAPAKKPAAKVTGASKIVARVKEYAYPYGTDPKKWAWKTGSAKPAYKVGLKKYCGKSARVSQTDCGYFVNTVVRAAGLGSKFDALPDSSSQPYPKLVGNLKIVYKGKKIKSGVLKAGDVIRYKKSSGQHTMIYMGDGKIAEAQRSGAKVGKNFPAIKKDTHKYNASNVKPSTIQVLRAK